MTVQTRPKTRKTDSDWLLVQMTVSTILQAKAKIIPEKTMDSVVERRTTQKMGQQARMLETR